MRNVYVVSCGKGIKSNRYIPTLIVDEAEAMDFLSNGMDDLPGLDFVVDTWIIDEETGYSEQVLPQG